MQTMKRMLSWLLVLVMVLGLLPVTARAAHDNEVHVIVENTTFDKDVPNAAGNKAAWEGTLVDKWVTLESGMTMMDCFEKALEGHEVTGKIENGALTYIAEIDGLGEFDGGIISDGTGVTKDNSGWMGTLNGWFTSVGFEQIKQPTGSNVRGNQLVAGDELRMMYTVDGGIDLSGPFEAEKTTVWLSSLTFSEGTLDKAIAQTGGDYVLTVPAGTTEVKVNAVAANKQYPIQTYVGSTKYRPSQMVPVEDGTVITIKSGLNTNWNEDDCVTYSVTVAEEKAASAPMLTKLEEEAQENGVYKSIDLTAEKPQMILAENKTAYMLRASWEGDYTVTATYPGNTKGVAMSKGGWSNLTDLPSGTWDLVITVQDNASEAQTVYTIAVTNPEPELEDNNKLYNVILEYGDGNTWPYPKATVFQANEDGVQQASTNITNDHKYYVAELEAGYGRFKLTVSGAGENAKTRYSADGENWSDSFWKNESDATLPYKVQTQIISEKEYNSGTPGWDGKTTNYFTVWIKGHEEETSDAPVTAKVSFTSQAENAFLHAPQLNVEVSSDLAERYGYKDEVSSKENVSALDVLVRAHEMTFGADDVKTYLDVGDNGWINTFFGMGSNVGIGVNGTQPGNGSLMVNQAPVVTGDFVEFVYYQDASWGDLYTWFGSANTDRAALTGTAGQNLEVTLTGISFMSMGYGAEETKVAGAQLAWVDAATGALTDITGAVTNAEGKATIKLPAAGTHYLTAYVEEGTPIFLAFQEVKVEAAAVDETPELTNFQINLKSGKFAKSMSFQKDTREYDVVIDMAGASYVSYTMQATFDDSKYDVSADYIQFSTASTTDLSSGNASNQFMPPLGKSDITVKVKDKNNAENITTYVIHLNVANGASNWISDLQVKDTTVYQASADGKPSQETAIDGNKQDYAAEITAEQANITVTSLVETAKLSYSTDGTTWSPTVTGELIASIVVSENSTVKVQIKVGGSQIYNLWLTRGEQESNAPWEGNGTAASPFLLKTAEDIVKLDERVTGGEAFENVYFKMTNSITLPDGWQGIGPETYSGQNGTGLKPFSGVFDGGDYTITIPTGGKGLFNYLREATVRNLKIQGTYIDSCALLNNYIVDYGEDGDYNSGTGGSYTAGCPDTVAVTNVHIIGTTRIKGSGFASGYASGGNTVTIKDCSVGENVILGCDASGNSLDQDAVGSFGGEFNGTVENSSSAATVLGKDHVGGLIGGKGQSMGPCDVLDSTFTGTVQASGNFVGGITGSGYIGTNWGIHSAPNTMAVTVKGSTVTGSVMGANYVGGIFGGEEGLVQCWSNGIGYIQNNTFTGTLIAGASRSSDNYVGGIIGYMNSLNVYNVISGNTYSGAEKGIGGAKYIDTSYEDPTPIDGVFYVNTAEDMPSYNGFVEWDHQRSDDPLGKDAEKLCAKLDDVPTDPDQEAADAVIAQIDAIGEVTLSSKDAIEAAEAAYAGLTEAQKAKVTNHDTLEAARSRYDLLIQAQTGYAAEVYVDTKSIAVSGEATVTLKVTSQVETTYNTYYFKLRYDPSVLTYKAVTPESEVRTEDGVLTVMGYGADKTCGTDTITLTFTGTNAGQSDVTLLETRIDKAANANGQNAPEATRLADKGTIIVGGYSVMLPDDFTGADVAAPNADYTFTAKDKNYTYTVTATMNGKEVPVIVNPDGSFTIENVTGELVIQLTSKVAKSFKVTVTGSGAADVTASADATYQISYTFTVHKDNAYVYEVSAKIGGKNIAVTSGENGAYTIAGADVTGDITLIVNKTLTQNPENTTKITFTGISKDEIEGGLEQLATNGQDFTFRLIKAEGYIYTVKVNGVILESNEDDSYTIPGSMINGTPITVTIEKTAQGELEVTVSEYIKLDGKAIWLITVNAELEEGKVLTYDGSPMYFSDVYGAFAWLVISDETKDTVQTEAAAKLSTAAADKTVISYNGDVNGTTLVDVNDAQLTYNMYNAMYEDFNEAGMEKFLRADMNADKSLTVADSAAIINIIP